MPEKHFYEVAGYLEDGLRGRRFLKIPAHAGWKVGDLLEADGASRNSCADHFTDWSPSRTAASAKSPQEVPA
jgi:hypothetical protein